MMIIYGFLRLKELQDSGLSFGTALALVSGIGLLATAGRFMNMAVIVELSDSHVCIRSGFSVFLAKPIIIPLEYIHTIKVVGPKNFLGNDFKPTSLGLAYKWPQRKMLYAAKDISLSALPDARALILCLAERTGATLKINQGKLSDTTVSLEELIELLQLPSGDVNKSAQSLDEEQT